MEGLDPQRLWPANNKYHQLPSKTHASPRQTEGKTKGLCRVCVGFPWGFGRPHNVPIRSLQEDTISHCKNIYIYIIYSISINFPFSSPQSTDLTTSIFCVSNLAQATWHRPCIHHGVPVHSQSLHTFTGRGNDDDAWEIKKRGRSWEDHRDIMGSTFFTFFIS